MNMLPPACSARTKQSVGGPKRYTEHADPAIRLLDKLITSLEQEGGFRTLERDILVCALCYLEGEELPGYSVERWWKQQDQIDARQRQMEGAQAHAGGKPW